ncbi:MAG: hypothetical protein ACKPKO_11295, partial [Candidatus Fonsibacter sp.]
MPPNLTKKVTSTGIRSNSPTALEWLVEEPTGKYGSKYHPECQYTCTISSSEAKPLRWHHLRSQPRYELLRTNQTGIVPTIIGFALHIIIMCEDFGHLIFQTRTKILR